MPFTHSFSPDASFAVVVAEGACDLAATLAEIESLSADPRFTRGMGILADARRIDYVPSPDETRLIAMVSSRREAFQDHPLAIVVEQMIHYGLARLFAAHAALQGATVEVFRDVGEAQSWLHAKVHSTPRNET